MNAAIAQYTRQAVEAKGWLSGSTLENRFALRLSRIGIRPPDLVQQHPVGRYRLDFADPDVLIGIEADGFYHRMPGAAELEERLCAAVILIRDERRRRDLPMHRTQVAPWKKAQPSDLAIACGHLLPEPDEPS
jgi:hypothetical protein